MLEAVANVASHVAGRRSTVFLDRLDLETAYFRVGNSISSPPFGIMKTAKPVWA